MATNSAGIGDLAASLPDVPRPAAKKGAGKGIPPSKGAGKGPPLPGKAPPLPPPRGLAQRQPSSESIGPKLRPLFWTGLAQVPPESVWADLGSPASFDKAQLERLFALTDVRAGQSAKSGNGASSRAGSEEPRKRLRVLDDRTSQLLAIAFNKLPSPERLAVMIDTFEDFPEGLTAEAVLALHSALSEHKEAVEQIRQVATTPEAIAQLDMPEKVLLHLAKVPSGAEKLSCGALMVGPARELVDLRRNVKDVGQCSQQLRRSTLLRKCISTALAVGNTLNRGTARSSVRALVLPESLLKLDELRGLPPTGAADAGVDGVAGSVLDFIAQALVNEDETNELHHSAQILLSKTKAAAGVSLEEAETNCRQLNEEATRTKQGLSGIPSSPGVERITGRVKRICDEIDCAILMVREVKNDLAKTQLWSCCKGKVKSDDWFAVWVQFLEQLVHALGRAQDAKSKLQEEARKRIAQEEKQRIACSSSARAPLRIVNPGADMPILSDNQVKTKTVVRASSSECKEGSQSGSRGRKPGGCHLDDDAKMPDWSMINLQSVGTGLPTKSASAHCLQTCVRSVNPDGKENSSQ